MIIKPADRCIIGGRRAFTSLTGPRLAAILDPQTRSLLTFLPADRRRYTLAGADNPFLLVELSPLTFPSSADQARIMKLDAIIVFWPIFGQRRPSFCQGPSATVSGLPDGTCRTHDVRLCCGRYDLYTNRPSPVVWSV